MESAMDPSKKVTTHFVSARFEDLAPEVVEAVKMTVLDTAGAALAGSSSAVRARIGFIGLGVMGGRMAATLARAGHALAVHDVDPAKAGALAAAGAAVCASASEVAQQSEI